MTTNDTPMTREQLLELLKAAYCLGYVNNIDDGLPASESWKEDFLPRLASEFSDRIELRDPATY